MIGREANIIVVRGGTHGRSVYEQMVRAVEEFFPESKILDDNGAQLNAEMEKEREKETEERAKDGEQAYALRRASTGLSSIVGPQNGDRPGGFVLVVDGVALEYVCVLFTLFRIPDADAGLTGTSKSEGQELVVETSDDV